MYDLVQIEWERHLAELRSHAADVPELEREGINAQIDFMESTDLAVVVSQGQNRNRFVTRL